MVEMLPASGGSTRSYVHPSPFVLRRYASPPHTDASNSYHHVYATYVLAFLVAITPWSPKTPPSITKMLRNALLNAYAVAHAGPIVLPPQSGILTPLLRLRLTSMRPHLSSHSLPGALKEIFHGSSNISNQK
jgi:hypothetical protein